MKKIILAIITTLSLISFKASAMPKYEDVPVNVVPMATFNPTLVSCNVWLSPSFNGQGQQINVELVYSAPWSTNIGAINVTVNITTYYRPVGSHTGNVSGDVYLESVASPATYVSSADGPLFGGEGIASFYTLTSFSFVSYNGLD
jgi:hypothetical protein